MVSLKKVTNLALKVKQLLGYYLIKLKIIDLAFKVLAHLEKTEGGGGEGF